MDTLLVLGAGRQQLPLLQTAKRLGLRAVAIDPSPNAPGRRLTDSFYELDLADLTACRFVAERERVQGVLTAAADFPVSTVAHVCANLGLHGLSEAAASSSTNKRQMRSGLNAAGVPCPRSLAANTYSQMVTALSQIGGPAILKPTVSSGGRGVTRLAVGASPHEIRVAFESAMRHTRADGLLVEEFIDGPEFSVEMLTCAGRTEIVAVTDKMITNDPYCVEIGHSQPACLNAADRNSIVATALASVAALGIDWAASHAEIRLGRTGPRVMEIGARLGGGCITSHLVPLATGIDMLRAAIEIAMGHTPDLRRSAPRGAAIRFFVPKPGHVRQINGLEGARRMPGVCNLDVYLPKGDIVPALRDSTCRVGHVICEGADAYEAIGRGEAAVRRVRFMTEAGFATAIEG